MLVTALSIRKPSETLQIRHSSGTSILRQSHVPGDVRMSWKLPSSAGTRLLCLPGRAPVTHSPVLLEATPSPGMPLLPSGCSAQSGRVRVPPSRRVSSLLPLLQLRGPAPSSAAPTPPRAPSYGPPFLSSGFNSRSVLQPGPWGTTHCTSQGSILLPSSRPHLLASQPLRPALAAHTQPRPSVYMSRVKSSFRVLPPRIRKASTSAPTLSS